MAVAMLVFAMIMTVSPHAVWQLITGKYAVTVRVHACEHGDKPGAVFIR